MKAYIQSEPHQPTYLFISEVELNVPDQKKTEGFLKVTIFSETNMSVEWTKYRANDAKVCDDDEGLVKVAVDFYQAMKKLL